MSDPQLAMSEFHFLDEKRRMAGLSPGEEQRWLELRQFLGIEGDPNQAPTFEEQYPEQPHGYYGQDGNWYPLPPGYPLPAAAGYAPPPPGYTPYAAGYTPSHPPGFAPPTPGYPQAPYGYPPGYENYPQQGGYEAGYPPSADPAAEYPLPQPDPYAYGSAPGQTPMPGTSQDFAGEFQELPPVELLPPSGEALPSMSEERGQQSAAELLGLVERPQTSGAPSTPEMSSGGSTQADVEGVDEIDPDEVTLLDAESEVVEEPAPVPPPSKFQIPQASRAANIESLPAATARPPASAIEEAVSPPSSQAPEPSAPSSSLEEPQAVDKEALPIRAEEESTIELSESDAISTSPDSPEATESESVADRAEPARIALEAESAVPPTGVSPVASETESVAVAEEVPPPVSDSESAIGQTIPAADLEIAPRPAQSEPSEAASAEVSSLPDLESLPPLIPLEPLSESAITEAVPVATAAAPTTPSPMLPTESMPELPPVQLPEMPVAEPIPPATPIAPVAPSPTPSPAAVVSEQPVYAPLVVDGEHRVIVHTIEGHVRRGLVRNVDLRGQAIQLQSQGESAPEEIPTQRIKAIFFMSHGPASAGERPAPEGAKKVRVLLMDGRQLAGFSTDFQELKSGFFLVPADGRTNTSRVYLYKSSVQSISED